MKHRCRLIRRSYREKDLENNVLTIRGKCNSVNHISKFSFLLPHINPVEFMGCRLTTGRRNCLFCWVCFGLGFFWSFLTSCWLCSPETVTEWCCSWWYQISSDTWTCIFPNLFQWITNMWNLTSLSMASSCVCHWSRTWKWKISPL